MVRVSEGSSHQESTVCTVGAQKLPFEGLAENLERSIEQ